MFDVCHDEHPAEGAALAQVECEGAVTKSCDARVVDSLECDACMGRGQCGLGGGITLTSAPMSTRNCRPLVQLVTKNRRLGCAGPVALVVINDWPRCFPTRNKEGYTFGRNPQNCGNTNTGWSRLGGRDGGWLPRNRNGNGSGRGLVCCQTPTVAGRLAG